MSPFTRFYYAVKPLLPRRLRTFMRRHHARRVLKDSVGTWPIFPGSERPPENWPGWPDRKQFAVVLTHDVEGQKGYDQIRPLMALERELGFRSSLNLIPEGPYRVEPELRRELEQEGFEVGVHDLHHDGKLYGSREEFSRRAKQINHYVKEWGASGFRSAYMHHNLEWLGELDVAYDASTFDTDPFEPQPDGVGTMFPFWVPRIPNPISDLPSPSSPVEPSGFVELPYTLVQDSTLFLYLGEKTIDRWKEKVDWIARHGGMVLVNVHPDYMNFGAQHSGHVFSASLYRDLLLYLRERYEGVFWHALPREVVQYCQPHLNSQPKLPSLVSPPIGNPGQPRPIWIDLENTPHIPFFKPIIRELEKRGYRVVLSARDAYQTCELADSFGLCYTRIGRHYGRNKLMKTWGLIARSSQLLSFIRRERPVLSLNHGSRTQNLISNLLGIPTVTIMDYEHTGHVPLVAPRWSIMPDVVVTQRGSKVPANLLSYSGIKEDVYVPDFTPNPSSLKDLGLSHDSMVITVRPPATEAHYHNPEAEILFERFMNSALAEHQDAQIVLLPRNKRQEAEIRSRWPHWFSFDGRVIIPRSPVDGLNLLWVSDFVVSGGGTMNREAAAMGIPVYSIFRGTIGAVDRQLAEEGRLTLIESPEDIATKIRFVRRPKASSAHFAPRQALEDILTHLERILQSA